MGWMIIRELEFTNVWGTEANDKDKTVISVSTVTSKHAVNAMSSRRTKSGRTIQSRVDPDLIYSGSAAWETAFEDDSVAAVCSTADREDTEQEAMNNFLFGNSQEATWSGDEGEEEDAVPSSTSSTPSKRSTASKTAPPAKR